MWKKLLCKIGFHKLICQGGYTKEYKGSHYYKYTCKHCPYGIYKK